MKIRRELAVALVLTFGVLTDVHAAPKPEVALECGDEVTESVKLAASILDCDQTAALTITTSGVTLDLGTNTVDGDGAGACDVAIVVPSGVDDVKIRNGIVQDCRTGVRVQGERARITKVASRTNQTNGIELFGGHNLLTNDDVIGNLQHGILIFFGSSENTLTAVSSQENGFDGLSIDSGTGVTTITGSDFRNNHSDGITAIQEFVLTDSVVFSNDDDGIDALSGASITGNSINDNEESAVSLGSGNLLSDNRIAGRSEGVATVQADQSNQILRNEVSGGEWGIQLGTGNLVRENVVRQVLSDGIRALSENTISFNDVSRNPLDGIVADGEGNTIKRNTVRKNGRHGISVLTDGNSVKRNVVTANGANGVELSNAVTAASVRRNVADGNGFAVADGNNFGIRAPDVETVEGFGNLARKNDVGALGRNCFPRRLCRPRA